MKLNLKQLFSHVVLLSLVVAGGARPAGGATFYVSQQSANPVPPYADWTTAATNIQDAIDAAADGDLVLVTNGVYASGGKVMAGDLTNRVALNKALTVQSVNGPYATIIQGSGPVGTGAVRCAWLTNGATLCGFALQGGATRSTGTDTVSGGGVWCASSNAVVSSCIIRSNAAYAAGGGSYLGTLNNCAVIGNSASGLGGCHGGLLRNCTIVGNSGWGVDVAGLTNCIVYFNTLGNCAGGTVLSYCCTTPLAPGTGNFTNAPLVLADGFHLAGNSPCRGAGNDIGDLGSDIDGQPWNSLPAVGCDEWWPAPVIAGQPRLRIFPQNNLALDIVVAGQLPVTCWWSKDGVPLAENGHFSQTGTPNLVVNGFGPSDAGGYQVVVSNEFGMATSAVAQVVLHCVDAASTNPVPPYTSWQTAATTIQDAIDAAVDGEVVLVTNGLYAAGGKAMAVGLTNRATLDKALTVTSVNGPRATVIQGQYNPGTTNGSSAVRCAWLTNGAALVGFTLQGGATLSSGDTTTLQNGGGAWCASSNALVANCIVRSNAANASGAGLFRGTLKNSVVSGNWTRNAAAVDTAVLNSCTVVSNWGYGVFQGTLTNCISYFNSISYGNIDSRSFCYYCCVTPLPPGQANINADPRLLADGIHLASDSPCRGAGTNLVWGSDIDGDPWATPPCMGCDEWRPAPIIIGRPSFQYLTGSHQLILSLTVVGQGPYSCLWTKDGESIAGGVHYEAAATTNLVVKDFGPADAGAYQVVVSNAYGVATSDPVKVVLHCVDAANAAPVPPYASWQTAARTIQEAVDVAGAGDLVLVADGVYDQGGKVMAGDLTNRVAIDKAVTVQSLNGPGFTSIEGAGPVGPGAVRCAWLTNGAVLKGFTLEGGATRKAGDVYLLQSGGGVWAVSNAVVVGCLIRSNAAANGGGAYQGTLYNCAVITNVAVTGAGTYNSTLRSCTISSNGVYSSGAGGTSGGNLQNCLVYYNGGNNYSGGTFTYCCSTPLPSGTRNIASPPQLLADGVHLASASPCRAAGTNDVSGTDIDGQAWATTPSIGCDEWQPAPVVVAQPSVQISSDPLGFTINVAIVGQEPFFYRWMKDGVWLQWDTRYRPSSPGNLVVSGINPLDVGNYQVVVSNLYGAAVTSAVVQVTAHYVDAAGNSPVPPYASWATAATNIQDAIDAAQAGELVFVTNGVYGFGGKVMAGDLTNRVALDKPIIVQSVNGAGSTVIQGDCLGTNGPLAVRCAWLTNGATLVGFTLTGGATRSIASAPIQTATTLLSGGGVWGASTNAMVFNCILATNMAFSGAGAFQATLNQCTLVGNIATGVNMVGGLTGGGAANCTLKNCIVSGNRAFGSNPGQGGGVYACNVRNSLISSNAASSSGGGAYQSILVNCTVVGNISSNSVSGFGGGIYNGALTNCIVYGNVCLNPGTYGPGSSNYMGGSFAFCCTGPLPSGTGNIAADPQLLGDGVHLATSSPCRWTGTSAVSSGTDIEGQFWANPPSMGCDEWQAAPQVVIQPKARFAGLPGKISFGIDVAGQGPFGIFWTKDGMALEDSGKNTATHTANLVVRQFDVPEAGSYQVVVSNAFGMATSQVARVAVHCVNAGGFGAVSPFTNWATASTTIQEAIDAASANDVVLVTNGLYATGGKAIGGGQTNRIAVDKPLTVMSLNGPEVTVIQGAWDPVSTNGPGAVRCAWVTNEVDIAGFTLRGGATATNSTVALPAFGGGIVMPGGTMAPTVNNCIIVSNAAWSCGGGAAGVELNNCWVKGNSAQYGGGAYYCVMNNCVVQSNSASVEGGGLCKGVLNNCTVVGNSAAGSGGGVWNSGGGVVRNSIVYFNHGSPGANIFNWLGTAGAERCCTTPWPAGMSSGITDDPQLVDVFHLAASSPCRGIGSSLYVTGTDLDGDSWLNPPSIGCDEVVDSAFVGPLAVGIEATQTEVLVNRALTFTGRINGRPAGLAWAFGDGPAITNASFITSHTWTNAGDYTVTFTAFNTENPVGVSTNVSVRVVLPSAPQLGAAALSANVMQFQFSGQAGVRYVMEVATNLVPPVVWQSMQTNVCTGGTVLLSDPVSTEGLRFYRVRAE